MWLVTQGLVLVRYPGLTDKTWAVGVLYGCVCRRRGRKIDMAGAHVESKDVISNGVLGGQMDTTDDSKPGV